MNRFFPFDDVRSFLVAAGVAALVLWMFLGSAERQVTIEIREHRFHPAVVSIPAGERVKLLVRNLDRTPEEFEIYALSREKLIPALGEVAVSIGPLRPGRYGFFGELHLTTATGVVIAE